MALSFAGKYRQTKREFPYVRYARFVENTGSTLFFDLQDQIGVLPLDEPKVRLESAWTISKGVKEKHATTAIVSTFKNLVAVTIGGEVHIYNRDGEKIRTVPKPLSPGTNCAIGLNDPLLAVASSTTVWLYNWRTLKPLFCQAIVAPPTVGNFRMISGVQVLPGPTKGAKALVVVTVSETVPASVSYHIWNESGTIPGYFCNW